MENVVAKAKSNNVVIASVVKDEERGGSWKTPTLLLCCEHLLSSLPAMPACVNHFGSFKLYSDLTDIGTSGAGFVLITVKEESTSCLCPLRSCTLRSEYTFIGVVGGTKERQKKKSILFILPKWEENFFARFSFWLPLLLVGCTIEHGYAHGIVGGKSGKWCPVF